LYDKQQRIKFLTHGGKKVQNILEPINLDVPELMRATTLGGVKYFFAFIENHYKFTTIYVL
jgi:hypothetical protein